MNRTLFRSHRTFGFEVARFHGPDGRERVLLDTGTHKEDVSLAHLLLPVTDKELAFEVRMRLFDAIEYARFLGLDNDALRVAFEQSLEEAAHNE